MDMTHILKMKIIYLKLKNKKIYKYNLYGKQHTFYRLYLLYNV